MDEDAVFRALADESRRRLLDRLYERNGQTLSELTDGLGMTRQGATKHVSILEEANLIATVKRGREKLHYLNPVPIGQIADRWINKFERGQVEGLIALKKELEMPEKPDAVHMIHIMAPAQKVWDALTDADLSPTYFFGRRTEFGAVGERFQITMEDGTLDTEGVVLVRDEPHVLKVTWHVVWVEEFRALPPAEVEYRIEDLGNGVCSLTVSEFKRANAKYEEQARQGWSLILSGIKTYVETGKPMPAAMPKAPQ